MGDRHGRWPRPGRHGARRAVALCAPAAAWLLAVAACGGTATSTPAATAAGAQASPAQLQLSITVPPQVPANQPFIVEASIEGLQLVAPNGTLIPGTGHFHFFIDRPPQPPGTFTPQQDGIIHSAIKRTRIPGLGAGTHTITVAIADGEDRIVAVPAPASAVVVVTG